MTARGDHGVRTTAWRVLLAVATVVVLVGGAVWVVAARSPQAPPPTPAVLLPGPTDVAAGVAVPRARARLPIGRAPGAVAISPNGRVVYVADPEAGVVSVVDPGRARVTATISVPAGPPRYLAVAPDGRRLFVTVWDDARRVAAVAIVDTTTDTVLTTVGVSSRPFAPAVTPDGRALWVPVHDSDAVTVLDAGTGARVRDVPMPSDLRPASPHWVAFSPDGTRAYVTLEEPALVLELDTATGSEVSRVPVGASPYGLAVHPSQALAVNGNFGAASASVIDTYLNRLVVTVGVGPVPQGVAWSADGRYAYVVSSGDDSLSVIDAGRRRLAATVPTPSRPTGIAVSPDGRSGYVTCAGSGELVVLDLARRDRIG